MNFVVMSAEAVVGTVGTVGQIPVAEVQLQVGDQNCHQKKV